MTDAEKLELENAQRESAGVEPLECKNDMRSVAGDSDVIMYMPAGAHTIYPSQGGKPVVVHVKVDAQSAENLERQRQLLKAAGKDPFFSVGPNSHASDIAGFWPAKFFFDTRLDATGKMAQGVWVQGEWSGSGKKARDDKDMRTFSPTFHVDAVRNDVLNPAHVICEGNAKPNMGALLNDPAFLKISPLWAKDSREICRSSGDKTKDKNMETKETIEELQARNTKLEQDILSLQAKDDAISKADLRAARAELREIQAAIKLENATEQNAVLEAQETKRKKDGAEAAVQAMVASGAIAVRDTELQATYLAKFVADPSLIPLMAGKGLTITASSRVARGADAGAALDAGHTRITGGRASVNTVLKAIGEICAKQEKIHGMGPVQVEQRAQLALECANLYCENIRTGKFDQNGMPTMNVDYISAPIQAAADTDTIGTLVGTLVMQRALDLFKYKFPLITRIMTDLSAEVSELNQTVSTRYITTPAVRTYDNTLDTDGRVKGWTTASPGTTVDVNITLDELVGVPLSFSLATLSSTQRKLFVEQSEACMYALVKYFVAKIYAVCTTANYDSYAAVTAADAQGVIKVPIAYPSYSVAEIDFARSAITKIGAAFDSNEVPSEMRSLLLNAQYYAAGTRDPSLVNFFAGQQHPDIITDGRLPMLNEFGLVKAPNFPGTNNRVGFAFQKNGLLIKSRLPSNLNDVFPDAGNGAISTITDAETGFSLMMVKSVNHQRGFAEMNNMALLGAAKGDKRGGLVLTSQ